MTRLLDLNRLAPLALACSLTALGCDAPEKSVGQETEGESSSNSGSDSDGCDSGVAPCNTDTGSESDSDSDSGSDSSGSDTGNPAECAQLEDPQACAASGCAWLETTRVSIGGEGACEGESGAGFCGQLFPDAGGDDCGDTLCVADDQVYWTREVAPAIWEVLSGQGCTLGAPAGFEQCGFDGDDPAACDCMCESESGASLPEGFEPTLGASGCADMVVYGASPDGSIGLALSTGGDFTPVADAVAAGETVTTTHDVSEFARLVVLVGDNVTYPECNDALDPNAYSIDEEWYATAGTVEITIVPELDAPKFGTQGAATVTITGLEVTLGENTEVLDDITFEDVGVGWLPG